MRQLRQQAYSLHRQRGISLLEVLIALILLSVVVLGYMTLQLHANRYSSEAHQHTYAMLLAKDLAERWRSYPPDQWISVPQAKQFSVDCSTQFCQREQFALYNLKQVMEQAQRHQIDMAVLPCPSMHRQRLCAYFAWGQTQASDGDGSPHCTQGGNYVQDAQCVRVEMYEWAINE